MDDRLPTSPPSIQIHGYRQSRSSNHPIVQAPYQSAYAPRPPLTAKGAIPMSIPNAKRDSPPPPLPPPPFIVDLAIGRDPGWEWGNRRENKGAATEPLSPGSSIPPTWDREGYEVPESRRRESSAATIKQQSFSDMFGSENDEGYGSLQASASNFQSVSHSTYI